MNEKKKFCEVELFFFFSFNVNREVFVGAESDGACFIRYSDAIPPRHPPVAMLRINVLVMNTLSFCS